MASKPAMADQRVGAGRPRRVGVPAVLEELLGQLRSPDEVEDRGVVVDDLGAGERHGVRLGPPGRVLRPEEELGEGVGVARVVADLGDLGQVLRRVGRRGRPGRNWSPDSSTHGFHVPSVGTASVAGSPLQMPSPVGMVVGSNSASEPSVLA